MLVYLLCFPDRGDMQYMSRLIRLLKHFVPACILSSNPSGVSEFHKNSFSCYQECMHS